MGHVDDDNEGKQGDQKKYTLEIRRAGKEGLKTSYVRWCLEQTQGPHKQRGHKTLERKAVSKKT